MNDKTDENECLMGENDPAENTNLCCCYAVDVRGRYVDPCYTPVDACCLLPGNPSAEG